MSDTSLRAPAQPRVVQHSLDTLDAMAGMARQTGSVVHVVVEREPGVVEHARAAASAAGLDISVDLMPHSIRIRFATAR
jgi:hypothetical protein